MTISDSLDFREPRLIDANIMVILNVKRPIQDYSPIHAHSNQGWEYAENINKPACFVQSREATPLQCPTLAPHCGKQHP